MYNGIEELKSQRNPEEDMAVVFGCTPDQIAHKPSEIGRDTKAYVGPLEKGIFDKLRGVEYIYTSFPEGKIRIDTLKIGGKTAQQLERDLQQAGITINSYAQYILHSPDFTVLKDPQEIETVRLKVQDIWLRETPIIDQVYARAEELGLGLCPPETAIYQRLKDTNQPPRETYRIAMKPIAGRLAGSPLIPGVFHLDNPGEEYDLWLSGRRGTGDVLLREQIIFSLGKSNAQNVSPGTQNFEAENLRKENQKPSILGLIFKH